MEEHDFLDHIMRRAELRDRSEARLAAAAVFEVIRNQISPEVREHIGTHLKGELPSLWEHASDVLDQATTGEKPPYEMEAPVRGEKHAEPPATERISEEPPPEVYSSVEGPGNPTHYRSDPQLTEEIKEMLEGSGELDVSEINVFVQAGNVTLRGHVKSDHERDVAGRAAAKALGVGEIRNELLARIIHEESE